MAETPRNEESDAVDQEIIAWGKQREIERDRRFAELKTTWDAMMAKAVEGTAKNRDEVLAWCRQRIYIPRDEPIQSGWVAIGALKRHFARHDERILAQMDATLRAIAEWFLCQPDKH
jgi:hypothetical protein